MSSAPLALQESHTAGFWGSLATQTGANTLGRLTFSPSAIPTDTGPISCCAKSVEGGYYILACSCPASQRVYYLPYVSLGVAEALRTDYEGTTNNCDYFMTAPLTGCRFVLTQSKVIHVANNFGVTAMTPPDDNEMGGSRRRTMGENKAGVADEVRRRLSVTEWSFQDHGEDNSYGVLNTGIVFGYRAAPNWVYKFLVQPPASGKQAGTWTTITNP